MNGQSGSQAFIQGEKLEWQSEVRLQCQEDKHNKLKIWHSINETNVLKTATI